MIRTLTLILLSFISLLSTGSGSVQAQSLSVGMAEINPLSEPAAFPSIVASYRVQLNHLVSAALEGSIVAGSHPYHTFIDNSSLLYVMGLDCVKIFNPSFNRFSIEATAGYGWGHQFGHLATDHNYHAYSTGVTFCQPFCERAAFCISSHLMWRTWQGHMGFNKQFSAIRYDFSFRYYFGNTHPPSIRQSTQQ